MESPRCLAGQGGPAEEASGELPAGAGALLWFGAMPEELAEGKQT